MKKIFAILTLSLTVICGYGQTSEPPAGGAPASGQQRRPMPPPSNLKVLPKDSTSQQVVAVMRRWEGELGVECEYCHAKDPATGRNNFASDANPVKDKARLMLRMNMAINSQFVSQLDPKPSNDVSCGTCHRGIAKPTVFVPPTPQRSPAGTPPAASSTPPPSSQQ